LDGGDGHVKWVRPLPIGFTRMSARPDRDDVVVTGLYTGVLAVDGELRGTHGGTNAATLVLDGADRHLRGLRVARVGPTTQAWAFASRDGLVTFQGTVETFAPWQSVYSQYLSPCGHVLDQLLPTPVDLHVVADVSRGMTARDGVGEAVARELTTFDPALPPM